MLTKKQLKQIEEIIKKRFLRFSFESLGEAALTEEELKILQSEVEKQISKYEKLKKEVEGLLVQVDAQHKKKITQLVSVYSGMKAEEAAKILTETDESTTIEILLGMDQKKSSKILENMPKEKAVTLSEKIADKK